MKPKRVDCMFCKSFFTKDIYPKDKFMYGCEIGKRIMFRKPLSPHSDEFIFPRYCSDFIQIESTL